MAMLLRMCWHDGRKNETETPDDHFKRNSVSCPVLRFILVTDTGGLAPLRFKLKPKVIAIGRRPAVRNPKLLRSN